MNIKLSPFNIEDWNIAVMSILCLARPKMNAEVTGFK